MHEKLWLGCRIWLLHRPLFKQDEQFTGERDLCFEWKDLFDISFPWTYHEKWHLHSEEWAASQEERQVKLLQWVKQFLPFQLPPYFSSTVRTHRVGRIFKKMLWLQAIMDGLHAHRTSAPTCSLALCSGQQGLEKGLLMNLVQRNFFLGTCFRVSDFSDQEKLISCVFL